MSNTGIRVDGMLVCEDMGGGDGEGGQTHTSHCDTQSWMCDGAVIALTLTHSLTPMGSTDLCVTGASARGLALSASQMRAA